MASDATGIAGAVDYQPTENQHLACFICNKPIYETDPVYSAWAERGYGVAMTCSKSCHERRHAKCSGI